jgi:hypothetical protein
MANIFEQRRKAIDAASGWGEPQKKAPRKKPGAKKKPKQKAK